MLRLAVLFCLAVNAPQPVLKTTWDEPWHEDVVKNADSVVLAHVLVTEDGGVATCKRIRTIAGADVPPVFRVDGFYSVRIMSHTTGVRETVLHLNRGRDYYLFLKRAEGGTSYEVATPTSGADPVEGERVRASFRHSRFLSLVPVDLYEKCQAAIFRNLHDGRVDQRLMAELVSAHLSKPPTNVETDVLGAKSTLFFHQHVTLELFYYLGDAADLPKLEPFLVTAHWHLQTSAVRALSRINSMEAKRRLVSFLLGSGSDFAKVQAVWGLRRLDARELATELQTALPTVSAKETGFGFPIMDSRVGTRYPSSPHAALQELLQEWSGRRSVR